MRKTGPGKYKQRSIYGKTRAEVAQKLAEMLDQNHKGILAEPSKITVAECLERSIANRVNITEASRYKLRCETKPLVELIGDVRLQELRAHHVRDAYTALANQGLSLRAQQKAATHLRGALREAVLEVQKEKQGQAREFLGSDWVNTGLVFTTSLGTPIHPRNALRSFKRLIKPLDVTQVRLHDLRHTYASLALHRGVPVEVVSKTLGHARVDITLNIYRHLYDFERRAAALSLNELITGHARALN